MATQLTIHEAAQRLGVGASTLRTWGERLGVKGSRTSTGKRVYSEQELAVLEAVKNLRDQDAGFETIRRHIGGATVGHGAGTATGGESTATGRSTHGEDAAPQQGVDTDAIVAKVVDAIGSHNELAERYARAAHNIGQLEERVTNLTEQLVETRAQLAEAREKIALLEAPKPEPTPEAKRPWWKLWG